MLFRSWTYFNPNSENTVNMWSLNLQTEDEFYKNQEECEEDDYFDDEF